MAFCPVAAWIGGGFPDLDSVLEHRKSFHFPVGYFLTAIIALQVFFYTQSRFFVVGFYFFFSAFIHCFTDYFTDIREESYQECNQGVIFVHPLKKWIGPRTVIRYAGSPGDLLITLILIMCLFYSYNIVFSLITLFTVAPAVIYSASRIFPQLDSKFYT